MKLEIEPQKLPKVRLDAKGFVSEAFNQLGLKTFEQAACYIKKLAYGRSEWRQVLERQCGTCSSKHALLKALADENEIECKLILGIYEMSEVNTPGVGKVLTKYGLKELPEAHCFIEVEEQYFDFTFPENAAKEIISEFLEIITIEPDDIGSRKVSIHQSFLKEMYPKRAEELWCIREKCIEALAS